MTLKVGIVGSGIAGLATAVRLAVQSHKVEVFEANGYPGGKLSEIKANGYRFDAGPSLFTLPELVDDLFELAGEKPGDFFGYERLEMNCRYFFPDGIQVSAFADHERFIEEVTAKTKERPENIRQALKQSAHLYNSLSDLFMFRSLQDPKTFLSRQAFKAYARIPSLGFFKTMNGANSQLFDDERLVQLFNRYATYNGSSPYKTPATMNIIPHLEFSRGAYFPKGGMHAITRSIFELAVRLGVKFHFNTPVTRILTKRKRISGLDVNGEKFSFDRVVCNMDVVSAYNKLLPDITPPRFLLNQPKSSSALIFYWGIKKTFPNLDLHNIFFTRDYRDEFNHIFEKGTVSTDPTIYVNISSKMQSSDAPAGKENWFTMINVPNNKGQNWDKLIASSRIAIIHKLSEMLGQEIEPLIELEELLEPRTIESKTSSAHGALYGNSSNNLFSAFLRHANKSRRIKGLYFCGGSVHPGGGIPMSLSSARLVAKYFE